MSASDPATRISEPSVSRYALETHCWPASPPPRSARIDGSATLTTVASRPATKEPMIAAASASRWRSTPLGPAYLLARDGGRGRARQRGKRQRHARAEEDDVSGRTPAQHAGGRHPGHVLELPAHDLVLRVH